YEEDEGEVFLGRQYNQRKVVSGQIAKEIDEEVRKIIDECYDRAKTILEENMDQLHAMAEALMLYETIDAEQINDIMEGRKPRPPKGWNDSNDGPRGGSPAVEPDSGDSKKDATSKGSIGGPANTH
ncbi:MAG: ATP-dependent metalloprotease, partial [Ketobacter sp.]